MPFLLQTKKEEVRYSLVTTPSNTERADEATSAPAPMYDFTVLRELRKREGLTMEEVSQRSGISIAVISKLERNGSRAELDTLYRLARVFNMSATDLIALAESPLAHRKREVTYESEGFSFRRIQYNNVSAFLGEGPKGARAFRPEIHQDDYEVCWVLSGRLRLTLPFQTLELRSGETVQFDAVQHHSYEALEPCKVIILHLRKDKRF